MRSNTRRGVVSARKGSFPKIRAAIRPLIESLERRTLLTATPTAWYHFDEGSGTTAADASGNGNTATLAGDAGWQSQAVGFTTGTAGADLHLNGAGAADLGNPSDLNFSGQITISAWFKPTSAGGLQDIIAHGYGSAPTGPYAEVFMRINNGNYQVGSSDGGWDYQAVMPIPASDLNTWVNLTAVYDGYGWVMYHNGLQVDDQPETKGSMVVNSDWTIGAGSHTGDNRYFTGDIDEVKIFNQALYGQDILDQMGYQFPAPHATAAAPPVEGAAATLNLSATYASGVPNTITSWTVDWGDGTAASPDVQSLSGQSPSPTHTYGIAGNYIVQVTATDAQGIHLLNAAQLDNSFGTGGVTSVPSGGGVPMSLIPQQGSGSPAQEFYLAGGTINGNFGVARFTTNGILDPNFGIAGVSTISLSGYQLTGETVAVDDQNRILLAGYAAPVGGGMDQFAVARFNFDGTLDTSFGTNGLATLGAAGWDDFAFALYPYIDSNGNEKIMLGGRANGQGALVQYNDDGTPDTSFGYGGAIVPGGLMHTIYHLYRLANGQFLGGGFCWGVNGTTDYAVARYNANGSLDTSFGVSGVASANFYTFDIADTMAISPSGQILLTGTVETDQTNSIWDMAMAAFTPDGQPDNSFGTNGRVDQYWGRVGFLYGGQYEPDGKIIVTGTTVGNVVMQRFNADGTVDPTFNGSALDARWIGGWYYGDQVLIDSTGQAITLGNAGDPLDSWVLTRRLADVTLNVSPSIPTLSVSPASASEIDLFWHNSSPELSTIEIERSTDGVNTWHTVNTITPASPIPYSDTGLLSGTQYWYRLHLTYQLGSTIESFYSNTPSTRTGILPPAGLEVDQVGASHVTLSWQAATGATNYPIFRRGPQDQSFVQVGSSNTTSYVDTNLSFQTQYYYEVGDNGPSGSASPNGQVSATTLQAAPGPTNFSVTSSNGQAIMGWSDNSPGLTGFVIQRSSDDQSWFGLATLPANATTYADTTAVSGLYYYRIYAVLGADNSATTSAPPVAVYAKPIIASPAAAGQSPAIQVTDTLSVLGALNGGSEASLTYTWATTSSPSATFSANGTNAAKNTTVTFPTAGTYAFTVTISNGPSSITSSVTVNVIAKNEYRVAITGRAYEPGYSAANTSGDLSVTNSGWILALTPQDAVRQAVSGTVTLNTPYDDGSASRSFPNDLNRLDGYGFAILAGGADGAGSNLTWDSTNSQYTGAIGLWDGDSRAPQDWDFYWNVAVQQKAQVSLTAYRTGGNFGQPVAADVQASNDPSQYIVLVNDNYDQNLSSGLPDDSANSAPITNDQMQKTASGDPLDPDFGHVTLSLMPNGLKSGTVTLTLSDPSAVQLFKSDGTQLSGLTLDLSSPSGDLAPLASGPMDVWFEGLKADPDFSFKLTYADSSGNQVAQDSVHLNIVDFSFVDPNGSQIYQINPVWTDAIDAAENADTSEFTVNADPTQWGVPDDAAEVHLQGMQNPSSAQVGEYLLEDPNDISPDSMTISGQDLTSSMPIVLASDDVVAQPAATQPAEQKMVTPPNLKLRFGLNAKKGFGVKLSLGAFDKFFRNLTVQKLTIALDNNQSLYDVAQPVNVGYTVNVLNPAQNANYQIVTNVDGTWTQFNGTSHHFTNPISKPPPANVDGVYAYVFMGPNAAQQAATFIQILNASPAPLYGLCFAMASTAFYVGDAATETNQWFTQAWNLLTNNNPTSGNPISRNRMITWAYTDMFNNNPVWAKWCGMAAFASYEVGTGIAGGSIVNDILPKQPIAGEVPVYEALQEGNFDVFQDVYPQFLAYKSGGLAAIQAMGQLVAPLQLQGWNAIDAGLKAAGGPNTQGIWAGNEDLLQYEQQNILQTKVYNPYPKLWASVSSYAPNLFGRQGPPGSILVSPIPGNGGSFGAIVTPTLQAGQQLNIADVNQRWLWITDPVGPNDPNGGQLANYQTWAANNNSIDYDKLMDGGY